MTTIPREMEVKKPGRQAHRVVPGRLAVRPDHGAWVCEYVSAADNGPQAIGSDPWWAASKVCGFVLGVQVLAYLGVKGRDRAGMDHHHRADRLHGDAQTGE